MIFGNGYAPFPNRNAGADRSKANCNFLQVFLKSLKVEVVGLAFIGSRSRMAPKIGCQT